MSSETTGKILAAAALVIVVCWYLAAYALPASCYANPSHFLNYEDCMDGAGSVGQLECGTVNLTFTGCYVFHCQWEGGMCDPSCPSCTCPNPEDEGPGCMGSSD